MYSDGSFELNSCCLGKENKTQKLRIDLGEEKAVLCASGPFHTIISTKSNKIYSWGLNLNW